MFSLVLVRAESVEIIGHDHCGRPIHAEITSGGDAPKGRPSGTTKNVPCREVSHPSDTRIAALAKFYASQEGVGEEGEGISPFHPKGGINRRAFRQVGGFPKGEPLYNPQGGGHVEKLAALLGSLSGEGSVSSRDLE